MNAVLSPASSAASMRLAAPSASPLVAEKEIYGSRLPLADADIIELGCGSAIQTLSIAKAFPGARITAMEVDTVQNKLNAALDAPPNVRFVACGAQAIAAANASADVVMMFKSLHHVPNDLLDTALREIRRVLRPGGLAWISEPVFAGDLNEVVRIFHDEEKVRLAAFGALQRAVASGLLELVEEFFFETTMRYADFAEFERLMIGATHTAHRLDAGQHRRVRERFERSMTPGGAVFRTPMRVDLLRRE